METECKTCKISGIFFKNDKIKFCYKCIMKDEHHCIQCNRLTNKKYEKCFNCAAPYKCGDCGSGMLNNKYKICFNCNYKKKCLYCHSTGLMYYGDNVWGSCIFCYKQK